MKILKSIILALVIVILYAGLLTSIFPNVEENISWESHLFGGIVGLFTAFIFKSVIEDDELLYSINPWENDNTEKEYFLSRDAFEKTKQQRYYEQLEARRIQSNPNNSSIN